MQLFVQSISPLNCSLGRESGGEKMNRAWVNESSTFSRIVKQYHIHSLSLYATFSREGFDSPSRFVRIVPP